MSEADDGGAREFERTVRRALDDPRRPTNDGGPPTMPTEVVRPPSMRPDPGPHDPLGGSGGRPSRQVPPVENGRSTVPRPEAPSARLQPQSPSPQRQSGYPQPQPQQRLQPQSPSPQQQPGYPQPQQSRPGAAPQPQPRPQRPSRPQNQTQSHTQNQTQYPQQRLEHRDHEHRRAEPPPFGYQADYGNDPQRRSAGAGPATDQRRAVAEQWADPRSARPQQKQRPRSKGRRKREAKEVQGNRAREAKWASNRWAVPYFTDGPKVTLGVLWFVLLMGGALLGFDYDNSAVSSVAVAVVTSTVAALAGLQIGFAWFPKNPATRSWTAVAAFAVGIAGFYGPWGVVIGLIIGLLVLIGYLMLYRGHRRTSAQLFDVLVRASIPVGLASASLGAMAYRNLPVLIALILFVSAYEVGDFLVGSGAFNPVEGPMAGIIAAGVVAFFLFLIQPDPFSSETIVMFVAVAGVCCVAGQYLASALLPRGNIWAPALRRLDSYLLVAPLWLLLLVLLPDIH